MADTPQIERHWLLLRTLSVLRHGSTVADLASEFSVSEKTIRRDLVQLQRLGFPIEERSEDHGRKRWHMRDPGDVPGLSFNFGEVLSLFLARRLLEPLAGTPFWEGAHSAFRKVRSTLGDSAVRYLDRLEPMIHDPHQRTSDYSQHNELIDRLMIAIEDRRFTFITYRSLKATEPVSYDVHPYGLVHHRGSLYLVADSQQHGEFRVFKVDRISDVNTEDLRFDRRKDFELRSFFNRSFGVWREDGEPVTVVIRFAAAVARYVDEHHWPGCEKKTSTHDGGLLCEFRLSGLQEITSWILSFGSKAVVLEPPELVKSIRTEVEHLAWYYESRTSSSAAEKSETASRPTP
jgi:predicted DNA-binding transcriptional regulator YafY